MKRFEVVALENFPLIAPGDDIARIIVDLALKNGLKLKDRDVIVIAQKIVSKAEGRVVELKKIVPSERAREIGKITGRAAKFVELVLRETKRVVKASRDIILVEDKRGLICINAGIDKSNVEGIDNYALLPEDPDAFAEKCRRRFRELTSKNVAVIICDTYSRPFRRGQVNFAIGMAGINPFKDYRGKQDLFGEVLKVKNTAVADELAAAAELLMGQSEEARPVVIFRGLDGFVEFTDKSSIKELFISSEEDLFKSSL